MADLIPLCSAAALIVLSLLVPKLLSTLSRWRRGLKSGCQTDPLSEDTRILVGKDTGYPDGWWSSEKHFQLEQRAIFSNTWLYIDHTSGFPKPGAYKSITTAAGYPIFLIKGKDDIIRAFHNVCRHRAYPVTTKPAGSSLVLGCRYHGWSYDTKGRLTKAPKFDDIPGFNKAANSLFEIRTYTRSDGAIFVNLDERESIVTQPDMQELRVLERDMSVVDEWTVEGEFNWKLADQQTAFSLPSLQHGPGGLKDKILHIFAGTGATYHSTLLTHFHVCPTGSRLVVIRITPTSAANCSVSCTILAKSKVSDPCLVVQIKRDVLASIKQLDIEYAMVRQGSAIPEIGSQVRILHLVKEHAKLERVSGREVKYATRQHEISGACKIADDLCKELEMGFNHAPETAASLGSLDW